MGTFGHSPFTVPADWKNSGQIWLNKFTWNMITLYGYTWYACTSVSLDTCVSA